MTDEIDEEELRPYLCEIHDHWASYPCPYHEGGLVSHTPLVKYGATFKGLVEHSIVPHTEPAYKAADVDPLLARVEELEKDCRFTVLQSLHDEVVALKAQLAEAQETIARLYDEANEREIFHAGIANDAESVRVAQRDQLAALRDSHAKLEAEVEKVCEAYGDKGWAKTEMVIRLRKALSQ